MISEKMLELGRKRSEIREIFEYGKKRGSEIGADKVFDFSIGNPNVPAPEFIRDNINLFADGSIGEITGISLSFANGRIPSISDAKTGPIIRSLLSSLPEYTI